MRRPCLDDIADQLSAVYEDLGRSVVVEREQVEIADWASVAAKVLVADRSEDAIAERLRRPASRPSRRRGPTRRVKIRCGARRGGSDFAWWRVGDPLRISKLFETQRALDSPRRDLETLGSDPDRCAPCRATSSRAQTTKGFHSVGPGIEVDVGAGRAGPFSVSVFSQFRALRIVGDRKAALRQLSPWFTRTVSGVPSEILRP